MASPTGTPFPYHGPLTAEQVRGRDELCTVLVEKVTARHPVVLFGPRRFGKTSVLNLLAATLDGVTTVVVDLWGVATIPDMTDAIRDAVAQSPAPVRDTAVEYAASVAIDLFGVSGSVERSRSSRAPSSSLSQLLRVLTDTAARVPMLLVLDEFQAVAEIPNAAALLRTGLQHHYRQLGLVFSGSAPSTMRMLFVDRAEPFFAQADLVEIGPLDLPALQMIIDEGFAGTGRQADRCASLVHAFTAGHPHRSMQLAAAAWTHTAEGERLDAAGWSVALAEVRAAVGLEAESTIHALDTEARLVLEVIAAGHAPTGAHAERAGLNPSTAARRRDRLAAIGMIIDRDGWQVTDPMIADWILRTA